MNNSKKNFWLTPNGLSAIALIGVALYFLLTEHRVHFFNALPLLILLLCLLLHFFMHRGHGGHGSHGNSKEHEQEHKHIDEEKEDDQQ